MDSPSGEFAYLSVPDRGVVDEGGYCEGERRDGLTMYSQKSEFGKVMIAWNEYGPDPWGITGISYAAAILSLACDWMEQTKSLSRRSSGVWTGGVRGPWLCDCSNARELARCSGMGCGARTVGGTREDRLTKQP